MEVYIKKGKTYLINCISMLCMTVIPCHGMPGYTASWYSEDSCRREQGSCKGAYVTPVTSSGKVFDDAGLTCASWDYKFGTILKVTNRNNGRSVLVGVNDRGPAKRLYEKGRIIDLSKGAFGRIARLSEGIIPITVEMISGERIKSRYSCKGM